MRSCIIYIIIACIIVCYVFYKMGYFTSIPSLTQSVSLEPCTCIRELPRRNKSDVLLSDTTCSQQAHARGSGQKVVAFSFYEKDEKNKIARKKTGDALDNVGGFFFTGFQINIDLLPKHYPGWIIRIYHDIEDTDPLIERLCQFSCKYDFVDLCNTRNIPTTKFVKGDLIPLEEFLKTVSFSESKDIFPMIWRFFPTLDPQVDYLISRDLDSRFSARETAAVSEWLESGRALHAMRDHPWHPVPMLGGGWGARLTDSKIREHWNSSWTKILNNPKAFSSKKDKGPDQDILRDNVWRPWGSMNSVQHDSYCCRQFPGSIGFPTQRRNEAYNFFGSAGPQPLWQECPVECRREGHKEWTHC